MVEGLEEAQQGGNGREGVSSAIGKACRENLEGGGKGTSGRRAGSAQTAEERLEGGGGETRRSIASDQGIPEGD